MFFGHGGPPNHPYFLVTGGEPLVRSSLRGDASAHSFPTAGGALAPPWIWPPVGPHFKPFGGGRAPMPVWTLSFFRLTDGWSATAGPPMPAFLGHAEMRPAHLDWGPGGHPVYPTSSGNTGGWTDGPPPRTVPHVPWQREFPAHLGFGQDAHLYTEAAAGAGKRSLACTIGVGDPRREARTTTMAQRRDTIPLAPHQADHGRAAKPSAARFPASFVPVVGPPLSTPRLGVPVVPEVPVPPAQLTHRLHLWSFHPLP